MNDRLDLASRCAQALFDRDAASHGLGMRLLASGPGSARVGMSVRADMLQGHGTCHGGFLFALACNSHNDATVAQGCSIEYIAPALLDDTLTAECNELSRGKRTGTYDVRIENQHGKLVALFRGKSYQVRGSVLEAETLT